MKHLLITHTPLLNLTKHILSGCWSPPLSQILFVICMDMISSHSWGERCVRFGDLKIVSLLFGFIRLWPCSLV